MRQNHLKMYGIEPDETFDQYAERMRNFYVQGRAYDREKDPIARFLWDDVHGLREDLDALPPAQVAALDPDLGTLEKGGALAEGIGSMIGFSGKIKAAQAGLGIKSQAGSMMTAAAVGEAVHRIDGDVPVYEVRTMREQMAASALDERFTGLLLAIFAVIAMIVAGIGVFGVLSYGVRRRTREIGLRVALGAGRRQVLGMVARQGIWQLVAGLILGILFLAGLRSWELVPATLDGRSMLILLRAVGFLLFISLLAIVLPAWRAAQIVPTEALRDD